MDIRAALHWDNLLGRDTEPASALWSSEEMEDVYLRYVDLSEAVDLTQQPTNEKLPRQWAKGDLCPKLCYGRCPNDCPQYSNIARGSRATKATRETPVATKIKTPEATQQEPPDPENGSRTKKRRTREDFSAERAAELLSELHTQHIATVLSTEQRDTRTVKEYADSGLRHIELTQNDQPPFPPVGFALPSFEL